MTKTTTRGLIHGPRPGESLQHFHGKMRVAQLLCDNLFTEVEVEKEVRNQEVEIIGGNILVTYWFDVFGISKEGKELAVEVDGKEGGQGHYTKWAQHKGNRRDNHFLEKKVTTVRFSTKDLIGKKALPDATILEQIFYDMAH